MESLGSYLRRERELRQISIAEVSQTTRIPIRIITQLENDELEVLPADIFIRGYLRAYARAVAIDEGEVLSRHQRKPEPEVPPPLPAVYAAEPGRRFGIALALVILLILFTLALSIVLRPRHRDAPIELSRVEGRFESVPASPIEGVSQCLHEYSATKPSCFAAWTTARPTASSRS